MRQTISKPKPNVWRFSLISTRNTPAFFSLKNPNAAGADRLPE